MEYEKKLHERLQNYEIIRDNLIQKIADGVADKYFSENNLHNFADTNGRNLLHLSVRKEDVTATQWLLDYGLDVNAQTKDGKTPLMIAAKHNHQYIAKILLKANADVRITDKFGKTILQHFGLYWITKSTIPISIMLKLLEKCETEEEASVELFNSNCPLYVAVLLRNSKLTELLLKRGVDINACERYRNTTALHIAMRLQDSKNVEVLLANGADVNATDFFGDTPVTYLAECDYESTRDQLEIIKMLYDRGAMVDAAGETQMIKLLRRCDIEAVRLLLLRANFDLSTSGKGGITLLHALARNRHPEVFELLRDQIVNVNASNDNGSTALHFAAMYGHANNVRFLLDRGADVNSQDVQGITPLCSAMVSDSRLVPEDIECVELLLEYGAEVQILLDEFKLSRLPKVRGRNLTIIDLVKCNDLIEPILAQLALLDATGTLIKNEISARINSDARLKHSFNAYKQQLEQFNENIIHESVTMFQLLTVREKQLLIYLSDEQLSSKLEQSRDYENSQDVYYRKLRLRIASAYRKVQLKARAVEALCKIMQFPYNTHPTITDEICSYLSKQELLLFGQI